MTEASSDWVEILEPRSRERMYVNLETGECGWDRPAGVPVRQSDGNQWWELFDSNNNRFYYYNSVSQQTVWHRPQNCDVVPLAQLQAMKRSSESELRGHSGKLRTGAGGEGRCTPLLGAGPGAYVVPPPQELESSGRETPSKGRTDSLDSKKDAGREPAQRWQPAPGSKAAMLVKVNSIGRNQAAGPTSALQLAHQKNGSTANSPGSRPVGGYVYPGQADKATPSGKMAAPVDSRQALHLKKADNGNFCLVMPSSGSSPSGPAYQAPLRPQASSSRPSSPQYGATPPIYDEPPMESPIYDEPPVEMEVEERTSRAGPPRPTSPPPTACRNRGSSSPNCCSTPPPTSAPSTRGPPPPPSTAPPVGNASSTWSTWTPAPPNRAPCRAPPPGRAPAGPRQDPAEGGGAGKEAVLEDAGGQRAEEHRGAAQPAEQPGLPGVPGRRHRQLPGLGLLHGPLAQPAPQKPPPADGGTGPARLGGQQRGAQRPQREADGGDAGRGQPLQHRAGEQGQPGHRDVRELHPPSALPAGLPQEVRGRGGAAAGLAGGPLRQQPLPAPGR
ncbi:hypothetical protein ANANG_G00223230 [Anguilla anguilla]|uniref:WW domain-containing protein n=1 Tax=Anguilla anguilla TaxID=7936 RepID=A0A9D3RSW0_ANGAN|nr:hypothetical protein ANANG_G00223230 [Anguilla anguilla]